MPKGYAGAGTGGRPAASARATWSACRYMAAKVNPVDGRVAPPAVPRRTTRGEGRATKGPSVIGMTPFSTSATVNRAGSRPSRSQ